MGNYGIVLNLVSSCYILKSKTNLDVGNQHCSLSNDVS